MQRGPFFLLTLEDPHRFRNSRDVGCYLDGHHNKARQSPGRRSSISFAEVGMSQFVRAVILPVALIAASLTGMCTANADVCAGKRHLRITGLAPLMHLQLRMLEKTELEKRMARVERLLQESIAQHGPV